MHASSILASLSIIIPAYNCERYLPAAIDSVKAQRCDCQEIIVVDDGSSDRTREVATELPGVVCMHQQNAGAAAARNTGVAAATGHWLAFLDADDCWADDKIERQAQYIVDHGCDMVFGLADEFYSEEMAGIANLPPPGRRVPARCAGTMLIARERFLRAGMFPTAWRVGEFIDWYLRATEHGLTAGVLQEVVLHRRLHAGNSGRSAGDHRQEYLKIIKSALDRRRTVDSAPAGGPPRDE